MLGRDLKLLVLLWRLSVQCLHLDLWLLVNVLRELLVQGELDVGEVWLEVDVVALVNQTLFIGLELFVVVIIEL